MNENVLKQQSEANTQVPDRVARFLTGGLSSVLAVLAALLIGAMFIIISGHDPIEGYLGLLRGALASPARLGETLVKAIPLLLIGLGMSIAFKNSFWNIGGDGQLIMGALLATWVALTFPGLPVGILAPLSFFAGFTGGAIWSLIAGILKVRFNVNEVLSTMMLNYIALHTLSYLIRGPLKDCTTSQYTAQVMPQSALIPESLFLPILLPKTRLHGGLVLALLSVVLVWLLWRTTVGFEIELSGANKDAANYAGVDYARVIILSSILTGGLAGLVGWNEIFGVHHRLLEGITAEYGFLGIVVALLGGLSPYGVLMSAFLFSILVVGGNAMERSTGISYAVVDIINGIVILFVLLRMILQRLIMGRN
jgi:ABC-type uncharacterized transport system permease subunit